ncbi:MAG TPA: Mov34/MPN/PAD-1 family protein [Gaiellaceae bacterium]|nr:Mov34/MPN/PAD-1 family protein [Gaiellaceae bacterium]
MVVPAGIRAEIAAHARDESPNESCGLLLLDGDRAVEYVRGTNAAASPYRFELYIDPVRWADIGDSGLAEGVVHSHLSSPPRPSRTDVENIGLWEGKPYVIYSLRNDELAAWTIVGRAIEPLELG